MLEFLFVLGHEFMWGGDVDGLEEFLGLFYDYTLEVDFLGFDSALCLCGYSLRGVTID